jgi:hypothetical protein
MGTNQSVTLVLKYKGKERRCSPPQSLPELRTRAADVFSQHFSTSSPSFNFVYEPLLFPIESESDLRVVYKVAEKNALKELPIVLSKYSAKLKNPPTSSVEVPMFPIAKIREKETGALLGGGLLLPKVKLCVTSRTLVNSFQELRKIAVRLRKSEIIVTQDQLLISSSLNIACFSYITTAEDPELSVDVVLDGRVNVQEGDFCTAVQPSGSRYLRLEVTQVETELVTVTGDGQVVGCLVYDLNWRFIGLLSDIGSIVRGPAIAKLVFRNVL